MYDSFSVTGQVLMCKTISQLVEASAIYVHKTFHLAYIELYEALNGISSYNVWSTVSKRSDS